LNIILFINKFYQFIKIILLFFLGNSVRKMVMIMLVLGISFAAAKQVNAGEGCLSCHGVKGKAYFVNEGLYRLSVHGNLPCNACHLGMSRYPHERASRVKCIICHFTGNRGAPEVTEFKQSVHGEALAGGNVNAPDCQRCHGSHAIFPSADERAATARWNIPTLCSACHVKEYKKYAQGIHGQEFVVRKNRRAAVCVDCHMEHRHFIPAVGETGWKLYLINECGSCHSEQLDTYRKTIHGQITELGYVTVAKCPDCHGSHDILPPSEPNSMVSRTNIIATCGKCHPGATTEFTRFYAHPEEWNRRKYPLLYYPYVFMTTLLVAVFTFFFIHTSLWAYRALKVRTKGERGGKE
jgi:hypothetical protein